MKKLDIKQWESPILILLKNMNETKEVSLHTEDIAIKVKEIFPSSFPGQNIRVRLISAK